MNVVTVYSRRSCCLCHDAIRVIENVRASHPCDLRVVDIDRDLDRADPRRSCFATEIPVVELNGVEVFRHRVDAVALGRMLAQGGSP
jgi:glutaredoxin